MRDNKAIINHMLNELGVEDHLKETTRNHILGQVGTTTGRFSLGEKFPKPKKTLTEQEAFDLMHEQDGTNRRFKVEQ